MFGFLKRMHRSFPKDAEGRRQCILSLHAEITGDASVRNRETIDLLLGLIDGENDVFLLSGYVIYYLGHYKPFGEGNEETAGRLSDMILSDGGFMIPVTDENRILFYKACDNRLTIDDISEWEREQAVKVH